MMRTLLRTAAAAAALAFPAAAQDTIPAPLDFGTPGAEVAAELEAREMRVLSRGGGRDVHAASDDRQVQAVAVLAADSLVALIYYHPETPSLNAQGVFTRATAGAELRHGPPVCRRSGFAVWEMEGGVLEVRLRGPAGDGAPGAEIRYLADAYAAEMERRAAARRAARADAAARRPVRTATGGRRLLGVPVSEVPADPPAADEAAAPTPAPAAAVPAAARCA